MKTRYKVIILTVTFLSAFALGRYSTPERVRVETKTVEVVKIVKEKTTDTKKKKDKKTVKVVITHPDGTVEERTETVELTDTDKKTEETDTKDKTKDKEVSKETTRASDKVTISALGGWDLGSSSTVYGASVTKPILGPFTLGLWGLSNSSFGASVGLSF